MIPPVVLCNYCKGPIINHEIYSLTLGEIRNVSMYHKGCADVTKPRKQAKPLSADDVLDIREEMKEALP